MVVGDSDQCLVAGTRDHDGRRLPPADRGRRGRRRGAVVLRQRRLPPGPRRRASTARGAVDGVAITLASGRAIVSTPEHVHFAGFVPGRTPQQHMTYVMWKDGIGLPRRHVPHVHERSGRSRCWARCSGAARSTPTRSGSCRCTRRRPRRGSQEAVLAARVRAPDPAVRRSERELDAGDRRLVGNQELLDRLFAESRHREAGAHRLLDDARARRSTQPHYVAATRTASAVGASSPPSQRSSCAAIAGGARRCTGSRCSATTRKGASALESIGLQRAIRPARASTGWRFETRERRHGGDRRDRRADPVRSSTCPCGCVGPARGERRRSRWPTRSRSRPASSVRPGMVMVDEDGAFDVVDRASSAVPLDGPVYDLDVERTHNFVATASSPTTRSTGSAGPTTAT